MAEYIEREDALSAQNKSMDLSEFRKRLERIPAADVRRVDKCKWENLVRCGFASVEATCSACGKTLIYKSWWHFCPNCGAQVEREQEDK